ncbi:penicillin-binding protein 2 [Candidatus Saccharibacteria bacterium]|nr:penicillin-binding protein 2 [Candidatus Saccharibacteria bacterium]
MPRNNYQTTFTSDSASRRIKVLKIVILVALGIILLRLFCIQIIEHGAWVAKADEQHTLLETITAKRGEIYMLDHGEPVAVVLNQTTYQIVIDPTVTEKEDIEYVINTFAKDYAVADLDEVYNTEGLRYSIVAKNIPRATAEKIAEAGVPAIWLKKTNQRVYPEGQLASGLLGFVNDEGEGQYGTEGSLNKELAGEDGLIKATADVNKVALSIGNDNVKIPAMDGENIVLSVDRSLEQGVEELAQSAIDSTAATNASVLIMDPNTGKVITMANLPNYDPANYIEVTDASAFVNYTTEVPYEPASICKSFAFSAAINEGKMTADTTYFNQHYTIVDDWKIENAEQRDMLYGTISMKTALYWSLNTGSIQALRLLGGDPNQITQQGREKLYDYYYNKFRLGQITGIELVEAEGYIEDPNEGWGRDSTYANMTFGQNLGITMIQTATAFSAVVNGGYWRTPSIVAGTLQDGQVVPIESSENKIEDKILSDETSAMMRDMLIYNRGYRVTAGIDRPGYDVGGKSGTAQVIVNGAYDNSFSQLVGSYIGFVAPSGELPKYVIMVKMWGEGQGIGSGDAMDLFDKLSNYIIDYQKIKPGV